MSKKVFITGSGGMLGTEISSNEDYNYSFVPTALNPSSDRQIKLDITDNQSVNYLIQRHNPDIIINCAAFTDVDNAEINKQKAHDINVNGLSNLIKNSKSNTKIIHISSDYVFNGIDFPFYEDSSTFPLSYYGKTKLEAENILIGSNRKYMIIRPNVLFNYKGVNFFTFVYNALINNQKINVVVDQISNPTYVPSLVKIILDSIVLDCNGIFHYGSHASISRYDFAVKIAKTFNLNIDLINPVDSKFLKQKAIRPNNSTLSCQKIQNYVDVEIDTIEHNLNQIKIQYEK